MFKPIIPRDKTSFNYEERKNPETRPFQCCGTSGTEIILDLELNHKIFTAVSLEDARMKKKPPLRHIS